MAKSLEYERRTYGGKQVYVFDDHSVAILPWAEIRRERAAPVLLTLDYHADTCAAFNRYAWTQYNDLDQEGRRDALRDELLQSMDYRDPDTLLKVLPHLDHEEHIWAARFTGMISAALVVWARGAAPDWSHEYRDHLNGRLRVMPARPHHFARPHAEIFHLNVNDYVDDNPDQVIETPFLEGVVAEADDMLASIDQNRLLTADYILDIDLDYFRRHRALAPVQPETFRKLLRNAVAITIAREPRWVRHTRLDADMEADTSLTALEKLLVEALGERE
ncbi:MAG TPA: UPF0489 family protein [Candidatus Didemnitutus sp.]|jgi:hypothetical protein